MVQECVYSTFDLVVSSVSVQNEPRKCAYCSTTNCPIVQVSSGEAMLTKMGSVIYICVNCWMQNHWRIA